MPQASISAFLPMGFGNKPKVDAWFWTMILPQNVSHYTHHGQNLSDVFQCYSLNNYPAIVFLDVKNAVIKYPTSYNFILFQNT